MPQAPGSRIFRTPADVPFPACGTHAAGVDIVAFAVVAGCVLSSPASFAQEPGHAPAQTQVPVSAGAQAPEGAMPSTGRPVALPWTPPRPRLAPYVETRGRLGRTQLNEVLDTAATPQLGAEIETGVSGAWSTADGDVRIDADVAAFGRFAGSFRARDASGKEVEVSPPTRDRRNLNLALDELAARAPGGTVALALGKRRLRVGPGYVANPANPLAPSRPLLDPTAEGAGRWMASFERLAPQGRMGIHFAPGVRDDDRGVPDAVFRYRGASWEPKHDHFLALAETTLLVEDTEIGTSGVLSYRYDSRAPARPAFGFTARREVDNGLAFHAETLLRQGYERLEAIPECAESERALARCLEAGISPLHSPQEDSRAWHARFVLGGRRMFDTGAFGSLEWLHDSAGETVDEFARLIALGSHMRALERRSDAASSTRAFVDGREKLRSSLGDGSFTLRAKNHLAASVEEIAVYERVRASANAVLSLRDNSGVIGPRASWDSGEGLSAELVGAFPYSLGGGARRGARDPAGGRVTEADAAVNKYLVEARVRRTF